MTHLFTQNCMLVDLKRYRKDFCKEKVKIFATQVIISEDFIMHEMSLFSLLVKAKYIINQMLLERYWFIPLIFCMIFM